MTCTPTPDTWPTASPTALIRKQAACRLKGKPAGRQIHALRAGKKSRRWGQWGAGRRRLEGSRTCQPATWSLVMREPKLASISRSHSFCTARSLCRQLKRDGLRLTAWAVLRHIGNTHKGGVCVCVHARRTPLILKRQAATRGQQSRTWNSISEKLGHGRGIPPHTIYTTIQVFSAFPSRPTHT